MNIYSASLSILLNTSSEIELPANSGSTECAAECTLVSDNCVLLCILFWHQWTEAALLKSGFCYFCLLTLMCFFLLTFFSHFAFPLHLTHKWFTVRDMLWWPDLKRGFKCKDHTKLAVSQAKKADKWQVKKGRVPKQSKTAHEASNLQMISNNQCPNITCWKQQGTIMAGKLVRKEN